MLIALALALSTEVSPVDRRTDLQRFSGRLEQRLAAACRPADPIAFFSGLPATRFVYLDGFGAVFLLPPRSLPTAHSQKAGQPAPEISVSGAPTGPQVLVIRGKRPSELTDLEARIRETRKEAERMRAQADAAFADAERQLMPGLDEPGAPTTFSVPWTFFLGDEEGDARPPEQVEKDVKEAIVTTIVEDWALLRSLQQNDLITVSVELVTRPQPWIRAKPARTVTVSAKKADLDLLATAKITRDDLIKRVQTKTY